MGHLAHLLEEAGEPRASVVASLSRAALVSTGRLIYVLGPSDSAERVEHARQVSVQQARSHSSLVTRSRGFTKLAGLQAEEVPEHAADPCVEEISRLGNGARDGDMLSSIAGTMAEFATRGSTTSEDRTSVQKQLQEHIEWMWNVWSGMAHGYAWPDLAPGERSTTQHTVPGHWVGDFLQFASFTQLALIQLRDATGRAT